MPRVYIISSDGESIIGMDCEKNITVSRSNTVTSKSIMSGKDISDGYTAGLKVVSVEGLVTYSKGFHQEDNLNPIEFQRAIDNLVDSKRRFTLYSDKQVQLLDDIEDCVILESSVTLDKFLNAVSVNLTIQQVWISQSAQVGNLYLPPELSEGAKRDGSGANNGKGGKSEVEEKERTTIFRGMEEDGRKLAGIQSGL